MPFVSIKFGRVRSHRMVQYGLAGLCLVAVVACLSLVVHAHVVSVPPRYLDTKDGHEMILLHTISRHGERTPADTYPQDPYINDTMSPYGWGMLTNTGRMQMYKIGQFIRDRYDGFLGKMYSEAVVFARSTGANRAKMSCQLTLAGMWPPSETALDWNPELNWQPIPITYRELELEDLLLMRACPRYYEARSEILNDDDISEKILEYGPTMSELSEKSGSNITDFDHVQDLYSTLKAEESLGLRLPKWVYDYYPDKMIEMTAESFVINTYTNELKKLKGGRLLKRLQSDWTAATQPTKKRPPRVSVYTGHDSTVVDIARALGVWETQVPDYGITLFIEMYRNNTSSPPDYYVEVYLQNSTRIEPFQLTIEGCSASCKLKEVLSLRKEYVSDDWDQDCTSHDPAYESPPPAGP